MYGEMVRIMQLNLRNRFSAWQALRAAIFSPRKPTWLDPLSEIGARGGIRTRTPEGTVA
jgi:hypothetical protein